MPPDRSRPRPLRLLPALALAAAAVAVAGCSTPPRSATPAPPPAPAPAPAPVVTTAPAPAATAAATPAAPPQAPAAAASAPGPAAPPPDPAVLALRRLAAYQDQLRNLPPAELAAEITRLGALLAAAGGAAPGPTLELALALAQTRNPLDTVRALGLAEATARLAEPPPWPALARLLAARLAEQRRLEEALERQGQQLRDSQRSVQRLAEQLEALKAIERSLNNRSAAPPPAPRP